MDIKLAIPDLKIEKDKKGGVLIRGEITAAAMQPYVADVIAEAKEGFEMPGFRKGQVPENILKQQLNMMGVWTDAAHDAISDFYPEIISQNKLLVASSPRVEIVKLAPDNPLGFQIQVALMPEIKLPNYKKMGAEITAARKPIEVSDKEIDDALAEIAKMRSEKKEGAEEGKNFEITDETVKTLGNFKNVAELRDKIRENLTFEKREIDRRAVREEIAKKLIEAAKFDLPEMILEEEMEIMRKERIRGLEQLKINEEDYLKQVAKTKEELDKQDLEYAERQIRTRLILEKIAMEEKIEPSQEEIEQNVAYLAPRYPESSPDNLRNYVITMLVNEMVLELIEGRKKTEVEKSEAA